MACVFRERERSEVAKSIVGRGAGLDAMLWSGEGGKKKKKKDEKDGRGVPFYVCGGRVQLLGRLPIQWALFNCPMAPMVKFSFRPQLIAAWL